MGEKLSVPLILIRGIYGLSSQVSSYNGNSYHLHHYLLLLLKCVDEGTDFLIDSARCFKRFCSELCSNVIEPWEIRQLRSSMTAVE